jgi:HAD superfamily hydrolase (TIGR01509 family)
MIEAAIFDLDGTLMDSEVLWVEATARYLNDRGHAIGHEEALAIVYGRSWRDVYDDIIARHPELDESMEEMEESLRVYILSLREGRDIVIAESVSLLRRLAQTMPVCIVSGSPCADIETAVDLMGVRDVVAFWIGAEEYGPGKPDPTCFIMASERLGIAPAHCVVFEDSAAGVLAAKSAGMFCVALSRPGLPVQDVATADLIVQELDGVDVTRLVLCTT